MQISISWLPYRHWTAMCYDPKDRVKHARHSLGLCTMGKNCVGQRSLFTLGVYLNVYLKHLRLMSGSGHEGSSRSFPATFNRVFQAGKQSWVSAIVGALGYLEQQCPHCCLFHLAEDGLADFLWHRKQTSPKETALDKRVFDFPSFTFELIESS